MGKGMGSSFLPLLRPYTGWSTPIRDLQLWPAIRWRRLSTVRVYLRRILLDCSGGSQLFPPLSGPSSARLRRHPILSYWAGCPSITGYLFLWRPTCSASR